MLTSAGLQEQKHKLDVRREEVRLQERGLGRRRGREGSRGGERAVQTAAPAGLAPAAHRQHAPAAFRASQSLTARLVDQCTEVLLLAQVLLTLYASVVERFSAADETTPADDAAAVEGDAAFAAALLSLQERGLGGEEAAVGEILAAAAEHAGGWCAALSPCWWHCSWLPTALRFLHSWHQWGQRMPVGSAYRLLPAAEAAAAGVCGALKQTLEAVGSVRVTAELHQRLADFDSLVAQGGSMGQLLPSGRGSVLEGSCLFQMGGIAAAVGDLLCRTRACGEAADSHLAIGEGYSLCAVHCLCRKLH